MAKEKDEIAILEVQKIHLKLGRIAICSICIYRAGSIYAHDSADVAYSSIYSQAKKSVYLIDNYIGLRTLVMLKNAPAGVDIKLFSDNIGSGKLQDLFDIVA